MIKELDSVVLTANLNELVAKGYPRAIPKTPFGTKLEYDASTGTVKVVKQ